MRTRQRAAIALSATVVPAFIAGSVVPAQAVKPPPLVAGCRMPFVDAGGVRNIKFNYADLPGYTTLASLSAGRWNTMGPPQQLQLQATGYKIFVTEADLVSGQNDGLSTNTTNYACNGSGYFTGLTTAQFNTDFGYYANPKRFSVMVRPAQCQANSPIMYIMSS